MTLIGYTICFLRKGDYVLLLNRNRSPWMGMWNGVGGKIEPGEAPLPSVLREVWEETGIRLNTAAHVGIVWWSSDGVITGGMHAFIADGSRHEVPTAPVFTREGILDWKPLSWILDPNNLGVVPNIRAYLPSMLENQVPCDYHCVFVQDTMVDVRREPFPLSTYGPAYRG